MRILRIPFTEFHTGAVNVSTNIFVNVTQPILPNGQLHWAFNNIASYKTPTCTPLLNDLYNQRSNYLSEMEVTPGNKTIDYSLQQIANDAEQPQVYALEIHMQRKIPSEDIDCTYRSIFMGLSF